MSPAQFIDNPDWAAFLPEMTGSPRVRAVLSHEDCSKLDPDAAAYHLMAGGTLGRMDGYEERPGQLDMLRQIVAAFNDRAHLMIEAGTGVGKSLAYLVPSILWASVNDTPVIVSTATRNLQSQLVSADIPRALAVLGERMRDFRVALLKGRTNYLCLRALGDFFSSGYWTLSPDEQTEMPHFIDWLRRTPDGDLDHYEGLPRSLLTCPGEECGGRRCPFYSRCFVYRARRAAAEAHLVVANHSLVLAEALNPGSGILPAYGRLVLDEAHNLEDVATEYLSREFSVPALSRLFSRLQRRGRGRHPIRSGGILPAIGRQLSRGVLAGNPLGERISRLLDDFAPLLARALEAAEKLADCAARMLDCEGTCERQRYRVRLMDADGHKVREFSRHGLFRPFGASWHEDRVQTAEGALERTLAAAVNALHDLADTLDGATPEGELNFFSDLATQVRGVAESLVAFVNDAVFTLSGSSETFAYWAERVRPAKRPAYVRLVAAPLSVADDLRKGLYETKDSVVLSSATLRVGGSFRYMAGRLGFRAAPSAEDADEGRAADGESRYRALTAVSPFDYLRQSLVLAPDCLPDPAVDPTRYADGLAALLGDLFEATDGRALVLFTSYEMMNAVAARVRAPFAEAGLSLFVQGEGASREKMTTALKGSGRTVLFGAQSFWEGVDVAGEALSCVVIARLPFPQMGDPVVEARCERVDRDGGSSFRDYLLPEAAIRFRQGFGRLIRTRRDRGVVLVADPRLVTKNYGALFRKSIPTSIHAVSSTADLVERVAAFFDGESRSDGRVVKEV